MELKNNKPDEQVFMQTVTWSKAPNTQLLTQNQGLMPQRRKTQSHQTQRGWVKTEVIMIRSKIKF